MLVSMRMFVFLCALTVVDCQCMRSLAHPNKCRWPNPSYFGTINNTELVVCMDHCLSNRRGTCMTMHWIPSTRQCVLYPDYPQEREVECFISIKTMCSFLAGETCFEEDRGPVQVNHNFSLVKSHQLCKTLCRFHPACLSFLWNTLNQECRIQTGRTVPTIERRAGDVWMRTKPLCPGTRCALQRIGVAGEAEKDPTSTSVFACIKKVLDLKQVYGAQWNYQDLTCWLQYVQPNQSYMYSRYMHSRRLIEVIESQQCNEGPPPVETCLQKEENKKMIGGCWLDTTSEKECVELCKQLANCAAVSWGAMLTSNRCVVHQLEKPLIQGDGYVTYRPCGSSLPDHRQLVTSHFSSREQFIPWKRSTENAIHVLECAFKCVQSSCNSFSWMDREGSTCTVSEELNHQYVRK